MLASSKRVLHDISGLAVLYPARPCPVFPATDHQPLLRLKHRYSLAARPFIILAGQGQLLLVEIFPDGAVEGAGALAVDDPDVLPLRSGTLFRRSSTRPRARSFKL